MLRENVLDSKKLGRATHAACNLWFRLLVKVDDFGNFPDDAVRIRNTCFQWRRKMKTSYVRELINELVESSLISQYEVNGEPYLHFERFEDFQQMRYEKVARFPRLEMPPDSLLQRPCGALIAVTGDEQSPTAAMTPPHRSVSPVPSTKLPLKLSKRREAEGAAAIDSLNPWRISENDLPMGGPKFQAIFEHYFATRNDEPLSEAMERAIQRANKTGVKVPPQFFDAKRTVERAEVAEAESLMVSERPELEELAWRKR